MRPVTKVTVKRSRSSHPEIKMLYSVLLMSETQGVGKGTLGEKILAPIIGEWNVSFPSEQSIVESAFNDWMANKRLIVVHEIYAGQSSKAYNKLKSQVTDSRVHVNKKYEPAYDLDNWAHVLACSNSLKALKIAATDRRWFIPTVVEESIINWWAGEFLKTNKLVLPGDAPPDSAAKDEMIAGAMSDGMRFVLDVGEKMMSEKELDGSVIKRVVAVEEIRDQIRDRQQHNRYLESSATIRNMLKRAGMKAPPWKAQDGRVERYWKEGRRTHVMLTWEADPGTPLDWEKESKKERPEWLWANLQNWKWGR
jgi:Family of unknown function (DUF5906)